MSYPHSYQPLSRAGPQHLHGAIGLNEATAVRYHKNKALTDATQKRAMQSFHEGQAQYYDGGQVAQNRYLVGPTDDKDAYALISYFAILAAREIPLNDRQGLIALSDKYYSDAMWTKSGNWFFDNRKDILLEGMQQIETALKQSSAYSGKSQALSLASQSALTENLQYNDNEKFFLDRLLEAGQGMVEDANAMIQAAKNVILPGCKEGETKEQCDKRLQREKYIKYGLVGLVATSAILFFGLPYLTTAKEVVGGLFGDDKDE